MAEMLEIKFRPKDDPEFLAVKEGVDYLKFVEYMKDRDLFSIRLPVNNPDAYQYLRWLNEFYFLDDDGNYLNYILNIWDGTFKDDSVRPPTPREVAIFNARHILEILDDKEITDEKDRRMFIDFTAEFIHDAYCHWSYPSWICSGLAGCIMKWGTFEENEKPGDKYRIYEEWNK